MHARTYACTHDQDPPPDHERMHILHVIEHEPRPMHLTKHGPDHLLQRGHCAGRTWIICEAAYGAAAGPGSQLRVHVHMTGNRSRPAGRKYSMHMHMHE
jgi:hypothetical protein